LRTLTAQETRWISSQAKALGVDFSLEMIIPYEEFPSAGLRITRTPLVFEDLFQPGHFKCYNSGRGAAKSESLSQNLVLMANDSKLKVVCARETKTSIKDSSKSVIEKWISNLGLDKQFVITGEEIRNERTGSSFHFVGLLAHNINTFKSFDDADIMFIEEAQDVSEKSWKIILPTIRKPGSQIWVIFNPFEREDPTSQRFIEKDGVDTAGDIMKAFPGSVVKRISWRDNPFFTDVLKALKDYDEKHLSKDEYEWIWEGKFLEITEATIMRNIRVCEYEPDNSIAWRMGLDFSNGGADPYANTWSYVDGNDLYIPHELMNYTGNIDPYINQMEDNKDLIRKASRRVGDSSRPDLIRKLITVLHVPIMGARKNVMNSRRQRKAGAYKNSMIDYLKHFDHIYIHKTNCPTAAREFAKWKWQIDSRGVIQNIPEDGNDHTIDSTIYALEIDAMRWFSQRDKRGKKGKVDD